MSFWKTMPVIVHESIKKNTFKKIVSNEELLIKISNDLKSPHVNYDMKLFEGDDITTTFLKNMKHFFDKNYSHQQDTQLLYNLDIYNFFTKNAIIIVFYLQNTNKEIGYIVGKKIHLSINNNIVPTMEVSFFCIDYEFRNKHYTPYFINSILREFIIRYNISISTYGISGNFINSPSYAFKQILHRPINIPKLLECQFLPDFFKDPNLDVFDINSDMTLIYIDKNPPDNLINVITNKINSFNLKYFSFFKKFSKEDVKYLLTNNSFHNFLILDKNKSIKNFISFYEVSIYITDVNNSYKNASIYTMFFDEYNLTNIKSSTELISEYCSKHNLIDVLSFFDIFPVKDYYTDLKCLHGQGNINYYMFNYTMPIIKNAQNAYVTI